MSEAVTNYSDIEDTYLDHLIRFAFDLDDLEKTQQILEDAENGISAPDEESIRRTWQKAQKKMDSLELEEKRRNRVISLRRVIPQVMKVAACLLLALCIGVPVVLASSAEFRSRVIELLANFDEENQVAHFGFEENPDASFAVPAAWNGQYYVSWVPEGFEMSWCSQFSSSVSYGDAAGRRFMFSENDDGSSLDAGLEEQSISHADINGSTAYILSGHTNDGATHMLTIVWSRDEKWFELNCSGLTAEESLKIARNVRKIIR